MKLDAWEREPLWIKLLTPILKKKRFPKLTGAPETGKWCRIYAENCTAANGDETYADFCLGSENKLLVFFLGGGVSYSEYTAARPASVYSRNIDEGFYMIRVDLFTDLNLNKGIFADTPENPFRNWSKLVFSYDTGDFHCGAGDFPYTALDGSRRLCHHHGYRKTLEIMETVRRFLPAPEVMAVSGCSGGGFGAALLTDSLMNVYPDCDHVTCLVDSGFFPLEGWHDIAKNVWQAPEEIVNRIHSNNITLDALTALKNERGDRVEILFCTSQRDSGLSRMTNYTLHGDFSFTKESGIEIQHWLRDMMEKVQQTIPGAGIYIIDIPDKAQKENELTTHCIIAEKSFFTYQNDGVSCAKWVADALNGNVKNYGLSLLEG